MLKRIAIVAAAVSALLLSGCAASDTTENDTTTINFRLWDEQAAAAYEDSFAEFTKQHPDIKVNVNVVPWSDYWSKMRTDVAGGTMDDMFWINNSYYGSYVDSGNLVDVGATLGTTAQSGWEESVVDQFTRNDTLWGVPQLYDAGIATYYNKDLLKDAGIDPADLDDLSWAPASADADSGDKKDDKDKKSKKDKKSAEAKKAADTYLAAAKKLTLDDDGHDAASKDFDEKHVEQYGTNIGYDLQAILLPFIGSNGGTFQDGEEFAFSNASTTEAVGYLVDAINKHHVAPSAADTNDDADYSLNAFTQGKMGMFQSGLYNLKNVEESADFDWGVAMMPAGPKGRVSVTNGIVAAGNASSEKQDAIKTVMKWLGSEEGNVYLAESGAAVPGVVDAQDAYFDYWKKKGVDVSPFFDVVEDGKTIPAPVGANFNKGFEQYDPIFKEIFKGKIDPETGLERAEAAANSAMGE